MNESIWSKLTDYRNRSFRFLPGLKLRNKKEAVWYVNERGYILFWPDKEILFPSLWGAVAGNRPVPNDHDDPGHITWRWKDDLLGRKILFYAKVLRNRSTFISLDFLPYFYALSPNYGDPEEDYLITYQEGKLTIEEKLVLETLLNKGPLDSITLRYKSGLSAPENASRFIRALNLLQRDFRILPVGISESGSWKYAFIYDVFHRHFPEIILHAGRISNTEAEDKLLFNYFLSVGASKMASIQKLFNCQAYNVEQALKRLMGDSKINKITDAANPLGDWFILKHLSV